MSYTVLARRYRSSTFDEIVGQERVAQTLKRAIESNRVAHAFLFCGTRGTGKTSMARIMAKALNCLAGDKPTTQPCGKCSSCQGIARGDDIDVLEIDAASNTQVDKTREVILDNTQYYPARSRFKIYIIDEVHMLSKASFNALLKTLEEPPEHVKFILATTEAEKVLPTIQSRCQRYDFRNIPTKDIAAHLAEICTKEQIKADEDALLLVARAGTGSMRDALSLLDRLLGLGEKHLTAEMVENLLGLPRAQLVFDLAEAIGAAQADQALERADTMLTGGLSVDALISSLVEHLRNLLIIRTCGLQSRLVEVPGMPPAELNAQAQKFEPAALTQDIVILDELRRRMRGGHSGRALLDATIVRLALAEQFVPISELLSSPTSDAAPARPIPGGQKKNELTGPTGTAGTTSPPSFAPVGQVSNLPPSAADDKQRQVENLPHEAPHETADDDDDLPRPGKVIEGPSLKDMIQSLRSPPGEPPSFTRTARITEPPAPPVNVEPIDPTNLPAVWTRVQQMLADNRGISILLTDGEILRIDNGEVVIRPRAQALKLLEGNGKKEMLSETLTRILRQPVGVRFEVDEEAATGPDPADAPPRSAPSSASLRPTPEQIETARQEPLVRAVMDQLGASFIKVLEI